jgi:iron complex outermembrane recepter protein
MMYSRFALLSMTIICATGFSLSTPVCAQTADQNAAGAESQGELVEIIVTAAKRSEPLSKVPISATAIDQKDLTQKGVTKLADLSQAVPGVSIQDTVSIGGPQITLRGIGSASFEQNTESTVALYMDEFVLNPTTSKDFQLFDLERVEVLRGPQGTLYGKNSTGGAINFVTRRPSGETDGDGTITVGRYGQYEVQFAAETALSDKFALRVALKRDYSDGYGYNTSTNHNIHQVNDWAGRLGLEYKSGDLNVFLKLFGDRMATNGSEFDTIVAVSPLTGAPIPGNVNPITGFVPSKNIDLAAGTGEFARQDNEGVGLNIDYHVGGMTFSSITGFLRSHRSDAVDVDNSPFDLAQVPLQITDAKEVTQEFRLESEKEQTLSWIVGTNYFHQHLFLDETFNLAVLSVPPFSLPKWEDATSFAGYGDGTLNLGGGFSVVAGARITTDYKEFRRYAIFSFAGPLNDVRSKRWTEPTYRMGLNYQADDNTLLYVSYNRGYRSGAFDSGFTTNLNQLVPVNPEFVNNYEGGIKTSLFDHHLRLAAAEYYVQFEDQQVLVQPEGGICCSILNAGKAHNLGFELEGAASLSPDFIVSFFGTISNSKYDKFQSGSFNYAGATLGFLPKYNVNIAPEYRIPFDKGNIFISPQITFVGKARAESPVDPFGQDIQRDYRHVDGQVGYRDEAFSMYAWVKNASDERHLVRFNGTQVFGFNGLAYAPPLSFGLTFTMRIR